jgi:hypothetical protein
MRVAGTHKSRVPAKYAEGHNAKVRLGQAHGAERFAGLRSARLSRHPAFVSVSSLPPPPNPAEAPFLFYFLGAVVARPPGDIFRGREARGSGSVHESYN